MLRLLALLLLVSACDLPLRQTTRTLFFRGEAIATVVESSPRHRHVKRVMQLDDDVITLTARLDDDGFALGATSDRPGKRRMQLIGDLIVDDAGHQLRIKPPLLLVDLVHHVRATAPRRATLVDLSSAEHLEVMVERRGPDVVVTDQAGRVVVRAQPEGRRTGPGAFAEGDASPALPTSSVEIAVPGMRSVKGKALGGIAAHVPRPGSFRPEHVLPGIFFESDDDAVKAFAVCSPARLQDALHVAERVHPLVDARQRAVPPSARSMLATGGDCDGAAALVVAALRSCGYPARAVVGYKLTAAGTSAARLVPHAVAEVEIDGSWTKVDAPVPAIGSLDDVFLPLAEGLGGALTMGRVLGVIDAADVVAAAASPAPAGPRSGLPSVMP